MKQSLLRAPNEGIPLRGKTKKRGNSSAFNNFKPRGIPNIPENLDTLSDTSHSQSSAITEDISSTWSNCAISAAVEDFIEFESSHLINPLLSELSSDPSAPLESPLVSEPVELLPSSTSTAPVPFIEEIVDGGGGCAKKISSESVRSEKDEKNEKLEIIAGFVAEIDKLRNAIMKALLLLTELMNPKGNRNHHGSVFFILRLGEMTMSFIIGALLVCVLLYALDPKTINLLLNNSSEFAGPAPT